MSPRIHGATAASFFGSTAPATGSVGTANIYIGHRINFLVPGRITGFRMYAGPNQPGNTDHWYYLWDETNVTILKVIHHKDVTPASAGWWNKWIRPWIRINTALTYVLLCSMPGGQYWRTTNGLSAPVTHGDLKFLSGVTSTAFDPLAAAVTTNTFSYGVDVLFQKD